MKILHVTKKYPNALGGDAIVVSNLEKQQRLQGYEVSILTSNCPDIIDAPHVHTFGLRDTPEQLDNITLKRLMSLVLLFLKSFIILRKIRPDIIHTHSIDMAFFVSFAARFYNIPLVHTFHIVTFNDPRHAGIRSKIELVFLRGAKPKQIFVLSPILIDDFKKVGFTNVKFVPNGINLEDWRGVRHSPKTFAFSAVGRLEDQKGFDYLLDAAATLAAKGVDFQIKIAGEGAKREALEAKISQLGLQEQVQLVGRLDHDALNKLYHESHAYVLSSLWEGMPLSLLEAWAAKTPTIATRVSGVPMIADKVSLLVESANVGELADAMEAIITQPTLADKLSSAAYKRVSREYQWQTIARNMYTGI